MRKSNIVQLIFLILSLLISGGCVNNAEKSGIRRISFDNDWQFHYGDIDYIPEAEITGEGWKHVDLPHDWSVEMPFSKESEGGKSTGHFSGGSGWYVKTFNLDHDRRDKRLSLFFEGSYMETEIWLNGEKIMYHPYGYTSFFCDISGLCRPAGEMNSLAVKVVNKGKNSRWYSGSGIYRHIWLEETDKVYIGSWGTFISTPEVTAEEAGVSVQTEVTNESGKDREALVDIEILDPSGRKVGSASGKIMAASGSKTVLNKLVVIRNPALWSVDSPEIYSAIIKLTSGKKYQDKLIVPFGIRNISFSAEKGFLLNGMQIKLKGGCVHHDNGLLGSAAIDRAEEKKVELLKANGFNAVRCSHNPPSEKFLEACDRTGLLVIDEAFDQWQKPKNPEDYSRFFDEWHAKDIESMVLRDRNHPSVIMWSIGNEIQERADSSGMAIASELKSIIKKHDPTRPVTAAICEFWDNPEKKWEDTERAFAALDICGYNYQWKHYESDHRLFPERLMNGTESVATERAMNWDLVEKHPYVIGDFIWTAMDYLGESGIGNTRYITRPADAGNFLMNWPWFNAWCGDIDITGNRKPQCALRDILWGNSKIEILVHSPVPEGMQEKISFWGWPDELACWNWKGYEGRPMDVRVFTRYPAVRLYLNGRVVGEEKVSSDPGEEYTAKFKVMYEPGILKAIGLEAGMEKENILIVSAGDAAGIELKADRSSLAASGNDLSYIQVALRDNDGNLVQHNDLQLNLSVSGPGAIAAAGNAAPDDMESFRSLTPKTYRGRALIIVRPSGEPGTIVIKVSARGLPAESISINTGKSG
jgi:hypothetical protein